MKSKFLSKFSKKNKSASNNIKQEKKIYIKNEAATSPQKILEESKKERAIAAIINEAPVITIEKFASETNQESVTEETTLPTIPSKRMPILKASSKTLSSNYSRKSTFSQKEFNDALEKM